MTTACGCPDDAGVHYFGHSLEVCAGVYRPVWSCEVAEGYVGVYRTVVVGVAADEETANPWGLWSSAWREADLERSTAFSAASFAALAAIEDVRYEAFSRRGPFFVARLPGAPRFSLAGLVAAMDQLIEEKEMVR